MSTGESTIGTSRTPPGPPQAEFPQVGKKRGRSRLARSRVQDAASTPSVASIDTLAARNAEVASMCAAGRYQDAIVAFEEILTACEATLVTNHVATLTVAGNLAVACVAGGRRRRGIILLAANLADRVRVLGDEDPRTLTARDALAAAHRLVGDVDGALALSVQVVAQRRRRLGPTHPDTLTSMMGLALAFDATGDVDRAITLLTDAINDAERAHGPQHAHSIALRECRGALLMDPG